MPELLDIQSDFATALRDADQTARARRWLAGDDAHVDERIALYRATMVANGEKALSSAYPVIRQVVGQEFFRGLARAYQREIPSTSGDLTDFGAAFAGFVAAFEHTQSLPYLPDLARLEWAVQRAYGAADANEWDASSLGEVDPDRQAAIRFKWSPGIALVDSPFPIVRLWHLHQSGHEGEFKVDWDVGECALVSRDGFVVDVAALGRGDAVFMSRSLDGVAFGEASVAAVQAAPGFDLAGALGRAIASHRICGFFLDNADNHS
jgi:hypothetical protein